MRVVHVVTLIGSGAEYGGPARVALNQARELRLRGHDATVAAGARGYRTAPIDADGVPLHLFPALQVLPGTGYAGLAAPGLLRWLNRERANVDVLHVHLGRDLVTLPTTVTALHWGLPYVVQTHGMIAPSTNPMARPLDAVWTRTVLTRAGAVFYLTPMERDHLQFVAGSGQRLEALRNGVPRYPARGRVGCAPPEVLFAARLHPRKRPIAFVDVAKQLLASGVEARFTLVGPDEGEGRAVRAAIADEPRIRWDGPMDASGLTLRMAAADIFVLPSVREPYPMAVLEAMSVGLPVVVTRECGLSDAIARTRSGIVVAPDVPAMTTAVRSLLADPAAARRMGERGRDAAARELGMDQVVDTLLRTYTRLTEASG